MSGRTDATVAWLPVLHSSVGGRNSDLSETVNTRNCRSARTRGSNGRTLRRRQSLEALYNAGKCKKPKIAIVGDILDYSAVLLAIERCLTEAGNLGELGPCHRETLPNVGDLGRRQHTQMPAYGFVSQSLPFMIEELIITGFAATNG